MIVKIKNFNLRTIANSGQCFRIHEISDGVFNVQTIDKFLRITTINNNTFDFNCSKDEFENFYKHYFDLDNNYNKYSKCCMKNDTFLKKCINFTPGLKILYQNKFETIISFIISQRKSVKAIETSIERLCKGCGKKIKNKYGMYYSFPDAKAIVKFGKNSLRKCGLGYRTDYIYDFCNNYILNNIDLNKYDSLNDDDLLNALMEYKGIGIKVASCIALFAYHRLSICPKDVWINRVLLKMYKGKVPFNYMKYAGIIQQYWFNYTRINKI